MNTMIVDSSTSIDCTLLSNFKNRIKHLTSFHKHPANIKCTAFVLAYIIFPHCYMQMLRHFTEESHSFGTLVTGNSPLPHHVERNGNKNTRRGSSMHEGASSYIVYYLK